jgi:hypothetical protein
MVYNMIEMLVMVDGSNEREIRVWKAMVQVLEMLGKDGMSTDSEAIVTIGRMRQKAYFVRIVPWRCKSRSSAHSDFDFGGATMYCESLVHNSIRHAFKLTKQDSHATLSHADCSPEGPVT